MPQDIGFDVPFPSVRSPDADRAPARGLRWARGHGLVNGPEDVRRFQRWDIAGLMARWAPGATGAALDLTVDAVNVVTIIDDQLDGRLAERPDEVARVCADFHAVLHASTPGEAPVGAGPLVRACADVWGRICAGRSDYFQARSAMHWDWYLEASLDETYNRAHRRVPGLAEYFALRLKTGFVYPMVDLTEAAYGFGLSRRTYELPVLQRMRRLAADFVDTTNDVHSLEKEESRGDVNNIVQVLERETGRDRDECLDTVVDMVDGWCREFVDLESRLGSACAARGLTDAETSAAHRFAGILRSAMGGYFHWSCRTERYSRLIPAGEPAYTDLV